MQNILLAFIVSMLIVSLSRCFSQPYKFQAGFRVNCADNKDNSSRGDVTVRVYSYSNESCEDAKSKALAQFSGGVDMCTQADNTKHTVSAPESVSAICP